MPKLLVRVYSWENPSLYSSEVEVGVGEKVIIATEYANELGVVENANVNTQEETAGKILRVATTRDKEVFDQSTQENRR